MSVSVATQFRYSHCIGVLSASGRGFSNPIDIAFGPGETLYVLNRSNWRNMEQGAGMRITRCTIGEEYLGEFAGPGTGDAQFTWPTAIATDSQGNIYVSDEHRHDVQVLTPDGQLIRKWGSYGSAPNQLNRPSGLAIDSQDRIVVVDHLNARIKVFSTTGELLAAWGSAGSGPGEFNMPWGVGLDAQDQIYVADWRNSRVQKFSQDGQWLASFGGRDEGDGSLNRPAGVGIDSDGNVYVADWSDDRVQIYRPDGSYLATITGDADLSKWGYEYLLGNSYIFDERAKVEDFGPEKRFWGPTAVKIHPSGKILVADSCRHRIQIYDRA
ncbi:MAG: NHL repeat-containing protein [Chloroflexota bacterium]